MVHILKSEHADIDKFFKDLYYNYWANQQGDLFMVPAIDTVNLTLTILSNIQYLFTMDKAAQKTYNENAWSLVQAQINLKARVDEIVNLKEQLLKQTPVSEDTLPHN